MPQNFQIGDFLYKKNECPVNALYVIISVSDSFITVHDNNSYASFQIRKSDFSKFGKISWIGFGPRRLGKMAGKKIIDARTRSVHSVLAAKNGKLIVAYQIRKFIFFKGWKFKEINKTELFKNFRISFGIVEIPVGIPIGEDGKIVKLKEIGELNGR